MENKKKRRDRICSTTFTRPDAAESLSGETPTPGQKSAQTTADQLLARATRVNSSLLVSLNAVLGAKNAIDTDALACKQLACELENWERALTDLEAAVVASKLQNKTGGVEHRSNDVGEVDGERLLQTIELQKKQINALEKKLQNLLQDPSAALGSENVSDTPKQEAAADDGTQCNRMLITADRSGNLKFPIGQSVVTIGRQPTNDIHIRSRYLSRFHARIISDAKGAFIEDLDSANGVIVNARRVRRCLLRSGDRITLGKTQMQYLDIEEDTEDAGQA